jgi:endonuclease YncB( thermonuclease family)
MNSIASWVAALVLALVVAAAEAATLPGRVVGVHDNDTLTVLDTSRTQHKIRL